MIIKPKLVDVNGAPPPMELSLAWQGGALLICFVLIFGSAIVPLYNDWRTFDTFSHGLLIPFIAGYMIWQKRQQLAGAFVAPTLWALVLLLPAVMLGLVGKIIGDAFSERVGLVLCLSGIVWLLLGWQWFKRLSFPLAYLFLMIPLPYAAVKEVAYHLRILNAALAAPALRVLGIPVYRDAYYLHLPDITLEVADLCSGISSVFALFALGAAYIYFTPLRPKWKLAALLSTVPFAAFINLLRIILTAALAYYVSPAVLGMLIHELTGTITFFIALLLFIALCEFFQRRFDRTHPPNDQPQGRDATIPQSASLRTGGKSWRAFAGGFAVLLPAVFLALTLRAEAEVPLKHGLNALPSDIGGFRFDPDARFESYREPKAETDIARRYIAASGEWLELYVGFSGAQRSGKRLGSPKLQFPYGWNFVWIRPARLPSDKGAFVEANWMLTQNNQQHVLVLYWYQRAGRTIASELNVRIEQIRSAILERRTDGAVVRLAIPTQPEKIEESKARLAAFAGELYPELRRILPQ